MANKSTNQSKGSGKKLYFQTKANLGLKGFAPVPGYYQIKNIESAGNLKYAWANWKPNVADGFIEQTLFKFNVSCLYNIESIGPKDLHPIDSLPGKSIIIVSVTHNVGYKVQWDSIDGVHAEQLSDSPNYAFSSPEITEAVEYNQLLGIAEASSDDNYDFDEENALSSLSESYDEQAFINEQDIQALACADDELAIVMAQTTNEQAEGASAEDVENDWPEEIE